MSSYQKPIHLEPGDIIGIVSPSSAISAFPRRLGRGIDALEKLGFQVKLGKYSNSSFGKTGGTPEERAGDINTFFGDPTVKAIVSSTGGYNANSILPLLDYELISANPKIFCGYSDITALNLAITAKTKMVTFNGPTLLPSFGDFDGVDPFTAKQFCKVLCSNEAMGLLTSPEVFSEENLWWDKDDDRASFKKPATKPVTINNGSAEGILLGGNLETLTMLGGTEYMPNFEGSILFLEEMGGSTESVERNLVYLEQLGIFDEITGLIFGRPYDFEDDDTGRSLHQILGELAGKHNIPCIADIDFGHTQPMLTMPLGVKAKLDGAGVTILESAVL